MTVASPSQSSLSENEKPPVIAAPEPTSNNQQSQATEEAPEPAAPAFKPSRGFIFAFASICVVTLAAALDATSLSIALPIITDSLKGTAIQAFWSGTSFLVTSAVFQPVVGGLSHVFGRKELLLASCLFFAVGSLIPALAKDFTMMLVGRSIQGIGGGGILTLGEILVTDLIPLSVRGAWFGYLGSMWALGSVAGPLMGAGFAQSGVWEWIFYINLPIIGVGAIAVFFYLKLQKTPGDLVTKIKYFDWGGCVIFIASTVSFMIPLTWGGVMYSWSSWRTLFPLLMGVAGMIGFSFYERWISKKAFDAEGLPLPGDHIDPIIRFTIFHNITMLITYVETLIHGMILWSLLYYLPLYYEGVKGYSPIISGVALMPETFLVVPMSITVGVLSAITGRYQWAIYIGWTLTTLGCGILILLDVRTSVVQWIFINIAVSVGTGMLFPAMALGIQAAGRQEDAGHAVSFYSFIRVFGQALGVAVGGVAFQNQIRQKLLGYPLLAPMATQYSKDATSLVRIIHMMEPGLQKEQLVQAFADGLKVIWIVMTALSGLGLIISIFTKEYTLNQELKTRQGYDYTTPVTDPETPKESN